jgi:hypothetical protein
MFIIGVLIHVQCTSYVQMYMYNVHHMYMYNVHHMYMYNVHHMYICTCTKYIMCIYVSSECWRNTCTMYMHVMYDHTYVFMYLYMQIKAKVCVLSWGKSLFWQNT